MKKIIGIVFVFCFTTQVASNLFAQVAGDFRSVASGTWATIANWQRYNGTAWVAAAAAPVVGDNVITIQSPNTINVAAAATADQIVVNPGGTLQTSAAIVLTIADGVGVDLLVNGTFLESSTANIVWGAGSPTWQMGAAGTLIKTSVASSNNWQINYQGGISTIPATSNWIIRRNSAVIIPISTTSPGTGSFYPNLIIENNVAGTWVMSGAATFPITATTAFIERTKRSTVVPFRQKQ